MTAKRSARIIITRTHGEEKKTTNNEIRVRHSYILAYCQVVLALRNV